jgi:hypothetical protein
MKTLGPGQVRFLLFATFALAAAAMLSRPATAEKPKPAAKPVAKPAAKRPASQAAYAGYRDWKTINAEPIDVSAKLSGLCRPAGAAVLSGPHAYGFINIYVNALGREDYLSNQAPTFAEGTVIVKEKLTAKDDKGPHELGIMIKRESGYAPESGDWQYVFVDSKGNVTEKQRKLDCARCHQIQADSDYVYRRVPSTDAATPKAE